MPDDHNRRGQFIDADGKRVCPYEHGTPGCWWVKEGHPGGTAAGCVCLVPPELYKSRLPDVEPKGIDYDASVDFLRSLELFEGSVLKAMLKTAHARADEIRQLEERLGSLQPLLAACGTGDLDSPWNSDALVKLAKGVRRALDAGCGNCYGDERCMDLPCRTAAEVDRLRAALGEIATHPTVERNPDGDDQAAYTMRMIACEALGEPVDN